MPQVDFLTPEQLAERWLGKVALRTLDNWRTLRTGPPFTKVGGAVLYPLGGVIEYENKRTVRNGSV